MVSNDFGNEVSAGSGPLFCKEHISPARRGVLFGIGEDVAYFWVPKLHKANRHITIIRIRRDPNTHFKFRGMDKYFILLLKSRHGKKINPISKRFHHNPVDSI